MNFHETLFPTDISRGAQGGPERRTDVVVLGSGFEERNARWADSKRNYNAGYGIKTLDQLHSVISFFEERRGRLYGFRWRDHSDYKSCPPQQAVSALDQSIDTGDGSTTMFQLRKAYGSGPSPWSRTVSKPVAGSVQVAVNGVEQVEATDFDVDITTGVVTFSAASTPAAGAVITAGFLFDVPVRFDADRLEINLSGFEHGSIPSIPISEVRL
jgi:uncharacterized protein (TIGR02217 family)